MQSSVGRPLFLAVLALALSVKFGVGQSVAVSGSARNGGLPIGNAAIFLVPLSDTLSVSSDEPTTIDQVHLTFVPNVAVVTPGTEVVFVNSDGVLHNVFGPGFGGQDDFDLGTYDREERRGHRFQGEGLHIVLCHIHPEMAAYVIVASTVLRTLSDSNGDFVIEGVMPGRYRVHAWHARHWRDEVIQELTVSSEGVDGLVLTLGSRRSTRSP